MIYKLLTLLYALVILYGRENCIQKEELFNLGRYVNKTPENPVVTVQVGAGSYGRSNQKNQSFARCRFYYTIGMKNK
jgi:hypothetical protein